MNKKDWLRQYLGAKSGKSFWLVLGIFAVIVGIYSLNNTVGALFWFGLGGLVIFKAFRIGAATNNWLRVMEREGKLETVLTDFQHSSECLDGQLRLGQYWCYGKYTKTPLAYGDILRVYELVRKKNGIRETGRSLMAVTTSGETRKICELTWIGDRNEELNPVLTWMLSKNPAIQVGYKK